MTNPLFRLCAASAALLAAGAVAVPSYAAGANNMSHGNGVMRGPAFGGGAIWRHRGFGRGHLGFNHGGLVGRRHFGGWYGHRHFGGLGAAGVIGGLAAGALLGGAVASYPYAYDYPVGAPNGVSYCEQRFRSYNPATGTYLGYDGLRHHCP